MADPFSKTLRWSDLYEPSVLQNFATELRYLDIFDSQIDEEFKQTTISGIKSSGRLPVASSTVELIPNELEISKERSLEFSIIKTFDLAQYPQIVHFVETQCPYIHDFLETESINSVDIEIKREIRYLHDLSTITSNIGEFVIVKTWMERNNNTELQPFILASLIQKFYQQNSDAFILKPTSALSRIKNNIQHVNSLLNGNVNILKKYRIKQELDSCIRNGRNFEFLNNLIFQTHTISTYEQNMDIKFLSYISCADLKDKAIEAEPKPETLGFGESYPNYIRRE